MIDIINSPEIQEKLQRIKQNQERYKDVMRFKTRPLKPEESFPALSSYGFVIIDMSTGEIKRETK